MRVFNYSGQTKTGKHRQGLIEAENKVVATRKLQETLAVIRSIEPAIGVIPKSAGSPRDPVTGRFLKQKSTIEAKKCVSKDVIEQPMLDQVGELSAQITFKNLYKSENGKLEQVEKFTLMKMEFDQTGTTRETIVSDKYCFVPNNLISKVADELPGAEIETAYFDTVYYGVLKHGDLRIQLSNSYGGYQAFKMTPLLSIQGEDIPVFLRTKQIHHGNARGFEYAVYETLAVAKALQAGKTELLEVLSEPLSEDEWELYDRQLSAQSELVDRRLPKPICKKYDLFREKNPDASYKDLVVFIAKAAKDYMTSKSFSLGVEKRASGLIDSILKTGSIAAQIKDTIDNDEAYQEARKASQRIATEQKKVDAIKERSKTSTLRI